MKGSGPLKDWKDGIKEGRIRQDENKTKWREEDKRPRWKKDETGSSYR